MINITHKRKLLKKELIKNIEVLNIALETLIYSYNKCKDIGIKNEYSFEQLESYEALTSRFARIADILTQKAFKTIFLLLQEFPLSFIDKANSAEKLLIVDRAKDLLDIRELRNEIAHEYRISDVQDIFEDVINYTPILMKIAKQISDYSKKKLL